MPEEKSTPPAEAQQQQQPQFSLDYTQLSTVYTNFCHVTFTPEELILDFGLNTQAVPQPNQPVKLSHRVVMNFYTAKRLMNALIFTVGKFENTFGPLELDFNKRARLPGPQAGQRPGGGF